MDFDLFDNDDMMELDEVPSEYFDWESDFNLDNSDTFNNVEDNDLLLDENVQNELFDDSSDNEYDGPEEPDPVSFTGKEEDNDWNKKQAEHALDQEKWHLKQADEAADKGDFKSAKEHRFTADSWHRTAQDYLSKIKK